MVSAKTNEREIIGDDVHQKTPRKQRRITKSLNSQRGITFKPKIRPTFARGKLNCTHNTFNFSSKDIRNTQLFRKPPKMFSTKISENPPKS
jgi:hypothetical protein